MKNLLEYNDYFQAIQQNHKLLNGFYRINYSGNPLGDMLNIHELTEALRSIKLPAMVLEAFDMSFIDNTSDNILQNSKGAFMLLSNVHNGDLSGTQTAMNEMEVIAKQIIAFVTHDLKNSSYPKIDIQYRDFGIERIGPVFDNLFGCRVDFDFRRGVNDEVVYDKSMDQYWNNPPSED